MHCKISETIILPLSCRKCMARHHGLCQPLTTTQLDIVRSFKLSDRHLRSGTDLYRQGDDVHEVYNLLDGWVMLYQLLADGRRQILEFALPGSVLGFPPLLNVPMPHSAECVTDIAVCVFSHDNMLKLFREHTELAIQMTQICARDRLAAFDHLTTVGRRTARERLAFFLLEMFHRLKLRQQTNMGNSVELPLTQQHIADALGLTNVHVSRTLRRLEKDDGLITFRRGFLQLHNPDALADVAGLVSMRTSPSALISNK